MPYTQVSDVVDAAPQLGLSAQSKPSTGQVQVMIADVEREVDAILVNLGYTTPVTGTAAVAIVKDIVVHGVLAKVLRARAFGAESETNLKAAKVAQDYYDKRLAALGDPDDPLELDAPTTGDQVEKDQADLVLSYADEGFDDVDVDNPPITRNQVF